MDKVLRNLLDTGAYSDLTIRCGGYERKVHRAIICTRSDVFAAACKPNAFKEGEDGVIKLKAADKYDNAADGDGDDPEAVKLMIDFLYTDDYAAPDVKLFVTPDDKLESLENAGAVSAQTGQDPVVHAKIYALGSKYDIDDLKLAAGKKYAAAVNHAWNTTSFAHSVRIVYTSTPDDDMGLRNIVSNTILKHRKTLLTKEDVEAAIIGIDKLAYALLVGLPKHTPGPKCSLCNNAFAVQCGTPRSYHTYNGCSRIYVACDCQGARVCECGRKN